MFNIGYALRINKLFKGFDNQEINQFLVSSQYRTADYQSGQIIAIEGEPLTEIGLVLDGKVEVQKQLSSGKKVLISQLVAGSVFGEVIIFSAKNIFPSTISCVDPCRVMFIKKSNVLKICFQNEKFLKNLLQLLSEKIILLDRRLAFLSGETIRQKISLYLLQAYQQQKTYQIHTGISRQKMAEQFGISRPSLSRELSKMKHEEIIDLQKDLIIIKDWPALENIL